MLQSFSIEAFKSFPKQALDFRELTLLCGFNNSGKSSVIQSLRMYCNAFDGGEPLLTGHGGIDELRSKLSSPNSSIRFSAKFLDGTVHEYSISDSGFVIPKKAPVCYFLSADRLGPQVSLPVEQRSRRFPKIGAKGEYVVGFLEVLRNSTVHETLRHKKSQGSTLEYQLVAWLGEIAPGVEVLFRTDKKRDSAYFEFDSFRPLNVGFGLSYCLPILAAVLGLTAESPANGWKDSILGEELGSLWEKERKDRGVLLLIENPEAHLHPKGQTALGKFIARAAMCGVQFVIETQSDHLMDGIRIAVKESNLSDKAGSSVELGLRPDGSSVSEGDIPKLENSKKVRPDNVIFHYLEKDSTGETKIQTPDLDLNGKLSFWPEGFFDQTLKNRSILAR